MIIKKIYIYRLSVVYFYCHKIYLMRIEQMMETIQCEGSHVHIVKWLSEIIVTKWKKVQIFA